MIACAAFLALLAVGANPRSAPTCALASPEVEDLIARKARELRYAEYCQFRRYEALSDVDGDGKDDFIVLFTVEGPDGGNDHVSFMAVFLSGSSSGRAIVVETGRRGVRDPVGIEARRGEVDLGSLEYRPHDPMCW